LTSNLGLPLTIHAAVLEGIVRVKEELRRIEEKLLLREKAVADEWTMEHDAVKRDARCFISPHLLGLYIHPYVGTR
jgi:hypothetical protein